MADPIVFERVIDATVDQAFALFTEPERLRRWQAVSAAVDLRVGGEYRFTVVPGSIAYGTYTEIDPGKRLVYTWGWKDNPDMSAAGSSIQVDFEPVGDKTKVTMTHSGLDDAAAEGHTVGWNYFIARLDDAAANGAADLSLWGLEDDFDLIKSAEASWAVCSHVMRSMNSEDRELATPCDGYTVHDLVEHLHGSMKGLGEMIGVDVPGAVEGNGAPEANNGAGPSAEDYIARAVEPVLEGWRARGTDGNLPFGDGEAPASMMAGILSLEFLLHAWDFAQATNQQIAVPPALVAYVQELAESIVKPEYRGEGKGFAAATDPSSNDPLTVLAAFTGRQT